MISKIDKMDRGLVLNALRVGLQNRVLQHVLLLDYAERFNSRAIMRRYLEVME